MGHKNATSDTVKMRNDDKPAILHICLSTGWGGLEMYPSRMGKEFVAHGYRVFGLATENSRVANAMTDAGMEVFTVSKKSALFGTTLIALNRWLKARNVQIVHCHKSGDILISALLNLLQPRFTVFTEHMGVKRPKKDIYHRWVYRHVDQVLSISNETYQRNIKALPVPTDKIERLWLGTYIENKTFSEATRPHILADEYGLAHDTRFIGSVGRICDGKGQADLLAGFELIADAYPDTHLVLIGGLNGDEGADIAFSEALQTQANASPFASRIHLAGYRSNVSTLLEEMQIVCLPYWNEAFGLTAIEAMAQNCAIVVSDTGALPEILEDTGVYCKPQDPASIAEALKQYLDDSTLLATNAKNAYQRALTHFSMLGHADNLEQIYLRGVAAKNA
ncbi:glycosyltransferase family 4 protein [Enterovibrio sp. ZSDZ35]|uniref:Glycosyltransferase family 4 protein n=1 Tax=Enterovibrio qingdaonensis TaxID=2899818 RepID=A0ABT5QTK7_9GAMM|nr:glycosyltransferase family 4 protein [Enterovibrio sp. ZSDZ35]MDD1783840.1 glycosyltransferase family 4 protein [Enterovibrio sp. ZSDZ35]